MGKKEKKSDENFCSSCGEIIKKDAEICPKCGVRQKRTLPKNHKSRIIAAILAIFLGDLGLHKFYLGKMIGLVYLLFCWTFIPGIIGFIEGIIYLTKSDEEFEAKYL